MFTVKPFGKVVICAGTTGYNLDFDVRYLWMRQKEIIGSHFANAYECTKANELIESGLIRPVLWRTLRLRRRRRGPPADARQQAPRQDLDPRRRREEGQGKTAEGPGAIYAEVGLMAAGGVVHIPWYATLFRGDKFAEARSRRSRRSRCATARPTYAVYRSRDDRYKFLHIAEFERQGRLGGYWNGPEFIATGARSTPSWYQVPVSTSWQRRLRGPLAGLRAQRGTVARADAALPAGALEGDRLDRRIEQRPGGSGSYGDGGAAGSAQPVSASPRTA